MSGPECCALALNCPTKYSTAPVCDNVATCQGTEKKATCTANACGSLVIDNDSGCTAATLSKDCSIKCNGKDKFCSGQIVQSEPQCCKGCYSNQACNDADGNKYCNGVEICDAVEGCISGTPPNLSDGIGCTVDTCDEQNDIINHTPDATACNDGLSCNGTETCDVNLGCKKGVALAFDDGVACTVDTCDEPGVAKHTPDLSKCTGPSCITYTKCDLVQGCLGTITGCLIDGQCFADGAANPANACNKCIPGTSQTVWTTVSGQAELCNGIDDNCNGTVDEGLSQPC